MPYRLDAFADVGLSEALLRLAIDEHTKAAVPRLQRLWTYFRNPSTPVGGAVGTRERLAQEDGLPHRLTGPRTRGQDDRPPGREIVVENDIGWRIQAMTDFMFGKPVLITSTARDGDVRDRVERALDLVWEASGGIALFQDMALLGHVYGHVDLVVRADVERLRAAARETDPGRRLARAAAAIAIEIIEPTRGIPILAPGDYRRLSAYVVHFERELNRVEEGGLTRRLGLAPRQGARRARSSVTEVISATHWQAYEDERLVGESTLAAFGGVIPVAHIQNMSQPFAYEGIGEVEPLIPLQDELNTRLSDRASRVTMQAFKMYLAKGIDGFERMPVGPGQIWSTDNPEASIEAFGGDASSPSEEAHIEQVREALDKTSGVPPLATGVVRARVGNLSSANALRLTLMGLLSRTARKRVTYGHGITRASRLVLAALDWAGVLVTGEADRGLRLVWPDPLPDDPHAQALAARIRRELGVPGERVLAEIGYDPEGAAIG